MTKQQQNRTMPLSDHAADAAAWSRKGKRGGAMAKVDCKDAIADSRNELRDVTLSWSPSREAFLRKGDKIEVYEDRAQGELTFRRNDFDSLGRAPWCVILTGVSFGGAA